MERCCTRTVTTRRLRHFARPGWVHVGCWVTATQWHASASRRRICLEIKRVLCNTETEVAKQTCYLTQPQFNDAGPTIPSTEPISPCVWHAGNVPTYHHAYGMQAMFLLSSQMHDSAVAGTAASRSRDRRPILKAIEAFSCSLMKMIYFRHQTVVVCLFCHCLTCR